MSVDPEQPTGTPPGNSPTPTDTPDIAALEQRIRDNQAAYTQSQQELAQLRKLVDGEDPDGIRAVLEKYGYEIAEDDDPYEPEYTPAGADESDLARRLEAIEEKQQSRETADATKQRQDAWDGWEQHVKQKALNDHALELSARDIKAMKLDCVDQNGWPVPPAKADEVVKAHVDDVTAWLDQQIETRRTKPRVPHTPGGPGATTPGEPPTGHEQRVAAAVAQIQAHQSGA